MARRRKKSIYDIARQAGSISGRIAARRTSRYGVRGAYGDATDVYLRNLENRALSAYTRYVMNIRNKQGVSFYSQDEKLNNRKYSSRTYMGLSNG